MLVRVFTVGGVVRWPFLLSFSPLPPRVYRGSVQTRCSGDMGHPENHQLPFRKLVFQKGNREQDAYLATRTPCLPALARTCSRPRAGDGGGAEGCEANARHAGVMGGYHRASSGKSQARQSDIIEAGSSRHYQIDDGERCVVSIPCRWW